MLPRPDRTPLHLAPARDLPCSADLAPTYVLSSPVPDQLRSLCTPPTPTCDTLVLTNRISLTARFILVSSLCFPPPPSPPLASGRSPAVFSAPSCPATCTTLLALPNDPTPTCDYRTIRLPVSCPYQCNRRSSLPPNSTLPMTSPDLSSSCTARDLVQLI